MDTWKARVKVSRPIFSARLRYVAAALLAATFALAPSPAATAEKPPAGAKSGFVRAPGGVRIHYLEAGLTTDRSGPKPSLLFVPGWTMPAWIWDAQIKYFSKAFQVVAIDPRSQGESTRTDDGNSPEIRAGDIGAVIDDRKLAPVVLIGWSQGVADVLAYADQSGQKDLSGLVLVDGFAGFDADAGIAQAFMGIYSRMLKDRSTFTSAFVKSMFKSTQSEDYLARLTAAAE